MASEDKKKYKTQVTYVSSVLHRDLAPFLDKNGSTRSVRFNEKNKFLLFYLAGAKHAKCQITPKGTIKISYIQQWEHDKILGIVREAMEQAGYNSETIRRRSSQPSYDNLVGSYEMLKKRQLQLESDQIFLKLIPGLKEELEKAGTDKFYVSDKPCLLMGGDPVFEREPPKSSRRRVFMLGPGLDALKANKGGRIHVHATEESKKNFYKRQKEAFFNPEIGEKNLQKLKKRLQKAGLPMEYLEQIIEEEVRRGRKRTREKLKRIHNSLRQENNRVRKEPED